MKYKTNRKLTRFDWVMQLLLVEWSNSRISFYAFAVGINHLIFFWVVIPRAACISRIKTHDEGFYQYRIYRLSPTYPVGLYEVEFCPSRNWVHMQSNMYIHKRKSSRNPNSKTADPDRPKHDRLAACVNAQQYSSTTFVLYRLYSRKEKFGIFKKNVTISVSLLFPNSKII